MPKPTISLIIPVYNRPQMIADCLRSLPPSLPFLEEVIVVDDGSTDGQTPEAVRRTIAELGAGDRVRLIEQPNAGPGAARNTGAEVARGDWLVFLDSDDLWFDWTGEALQSALAQNPGVMALFLGVHPFRQIAELDGYADAGREHRVCRDFYEITRIRPAPTVLGAGYFGVRRELYRAKGGFVEALKGAEDTDLFYRMAGDGPFLVVTHPTPVGQRTSNVDSLTLNMPAVIEGVEFLLHRHRQGLYEGTADDPGAADRAMANLLSFWLHDLFWRGYGQDGYRILLREGAFRIIARNGQWEKALKLLFIPVLALLRPKNHRFRWRPRAA